MFYIPVEKITEKYALELLRKKYALLCKAGENRYPRRADFTEREVCAIKAFFGPWPRALEAAGLKPPRNDDRLARNREKRIRAKRNRRILQKNAHLQNPTESFGDYTTYLEEIKK